MSFAETQQIMADLQEIMQMLNNVEVRTQKLETEAPKLERGALVTFTRLERVAARYVTVSRLICGSEDGDKLMRVLSGVLVRMQMVYSSGLMMAGGIASMASGNLLLGGVQLAGGIGGFAITQASMLEGY